MASAAPSRFGSINGGSDKKEVFLKIAAGEVMAAFARTCVFIGRHRVRSIPHGKTVQFEALGRATAAYHTPGQEITGQSINTGVRNISIDDLLVSDAFLANIDEAMSHFQVRGEYATQLGEALAVTFDKNVAQVGVLAARASATVTGLDGGGHVNDADADTNADSLITSIYDAAQTLEEKFVGRNGANIFLRPAQYFNLIEGSTSKSLVNRDYTAGANGGLDTGVLLRVAGMPVVMSNHIPSTNVTTGPSAYQVDAAKTVALVMHPRAVGTAKLIDIALESAYDIRRQGSLMVAKMAVGHGILEPAAAVEIRKGDPD